ncbi:MAG: hypothetical protein ABR540_15860 [Acidimicrobiales bacterium]
MPGTTLIGDEGEDVHLPDVGRLLDDDAEEDLQVVRGRQPTVHPDTGTQEGEVLVHQRVSDRQ